MQILENISLIMTNYMKHVYTYFIVETFTFELWQNHFINLSNQRLIWPQKANAVTSTSCTMIIHLISLLQLDMQKKMEENRCPRWTFSENWGTKHTYQLLQNK